MKIFLITFFLFTLGFLVGVRAASVQYPSESSSVNSIFSIVDSDVGKVVRPGCRPQEQLSGFFGNIINGLSKLAVNKYSYANYGCQTEIVTESETDENGQVTIKNRVKYTDEFLAEQGGLDSGLVGVANQTIATVLNQRPASGIDQVDSVVRAIINTNQVNAIDVNTIAVYFPGTGYTLLSPIQALWGFSVSMVYRFLVIFIIFVALAILFRQKIGGQTVTIQTAIPNIAIAMILVPLSYAISGIFIDAVTIGTNATYRMLFDLDEGIRLLKEKDEKNTNSTFAPGVYDELAPNSPKVNWYQIAFGVEIGDNANQLSDAVVGSFTQGQGASLIMGANNFIDEIFGAIFSIDFAPLNDFQNSLGIEDTDFVAIDKISWIGIVVQVVVVWMLMGTSFIIFKKLIVKYLYFLLFPIFSPFVFASIALPGQGNKNIQWYLSYLGSASLYYIVTYAMFIMTIFLSSASLADSLPPFGLTGYVPPLIGFDGIFESLTATAVSGSNINGAILAFLAVVVFLAIPNVLDDINSSLGVKDEFKFFDSIIKSAKDSFAESRKGVDLAMKAGRMAGDFGKNFNKYRTGIWQAGGNALDRLWGIQPGEENSREAKRKARLQSSAERIKQEKANAKNPFVRHYLNLREQQVKNTMQAVDEAALSSGQKTEVKGNKITLAMKFGDAENSIDFNQALLMSFGSPNPKNGARESRIKGKLTITSEYPYNKYFGFNDKKGPIDNKIFDHIDFYVTGAGETDKSDRLPLTIAEIPLFYLHENCYLFLKKESLKFSDNNPNSKTIEGEVILRLLKGTPQELLQLALESRLKISTRNDKKPMLIAVVGKDLALGRISGRSVTLGNDILKSNPIKLVIKNSIANSIGSEVNKAYT